MIHAQTLNFVHRNEDSSQEEFMFLLQRKSKAIDDWSQDFQKLSNAIESFCFVDELEEDIIDRTTNVGSQVQEFSVDSVKGGLEEISLSRVFWVKELQ